MSDDLVKALRESKGWPTLGHAAADRIQTLEAELAFYKGFHDSICSTGAHVVVERTLLDECERAFQEIINSGGSRGSVAHAEFVDALSIRVLHKLRAQEKTDE